jgi:hypothetical protein
MWGACALLLAVGPDGADAVVKGTDFITVEGDRIAEVIGFLDQVPAAA